MLSRIVQEQHEQAKKKIEIERRMYVMLSFDGQCEYVICSVMSKKKTEASFAIMRAREDKMKQLKEFVRSGCELWE